MSNSGSPEGAKWLWWIKQRNQKKKNVQSSQSQEDDFEALEGIGVAVSLSQPIVVRGLQVAKCCKFSVKRFVCGQGWTLPDNYKTQNNESKFKGLKCEYQQYP